MSRLKLLLLSCLLTMTAAASTAPAVAADPPGPSCLGVLSSFAGQAGIRDQFAPPISGARVAMLASAHGDLGYCISLFLSP
jgi:hypothetical protein